MKITIAERFHPFSHEVGTSFLLPNTSWKVQVFPTRLYFCDLEKKEESFFFVFDFLGPIDDFTAELDLEKGCLYVFGKTQKGYMRYHIFAKENGIWLMMEKTPETSARNSLSKEQISLARGDQICLIKKNIECNPVKERLSLGMHKAQDWDLVCRRRDLKEIFPQWFLMAAYSASNKIDKSVGNYSVLQICKDKIEQKDRQNVLQAFENLFVSAFHGVLVPRVWDLNFQGIISQEDTSDTSVSPLPLLTESGKLIRSLFFQENEREVELLPCLPTQFHCGRMVGVQTANNVSFDFEWTKKTLRSVLIHPKVEGQLSLKLPKGIRSFRLRKAKSVETVKVDSKQTAIVAFKENSTLRIDRFEY